MSDLLARLREATEGRVEHRIRIGVTGTRDGGTEAQIGVLHQLLFGLFRQDRDVTLHHGDCIGWDAQSHKLARDAAHFVEIHPPIDPKLRAWCVGAVKVHDPLPYLVRNKKIVDAAHCVIAAPKEVARQDRGGTWSTVRYSIKRKRPCFIIWPDGSIADALLAQERTGE